MKKKRIFFYAVAFIFIALLTNHVTVKADTSENLVVPTQCCLSGNNMYFAFGCDGGGDLYKYNIKSQKKTLIASGKYRSLSIRGNYIYACYNKYSGSDGTDYYIYKINSSSKAKKKLANGFCPVILGNYIYYIGMQKGKFYGYTVDNKILGVYRMNFDGTGKKRIYSSSKVFRLLAGKNKLYMRIGYQTDTKYYSPATKKVYTAELFQHSFNTKINTYSYGYYCNIVGGGYRYYPYSNGMVYREKNGVAKKILNVNQKIEKLIYTNGYIVIVTESGNKAYAYMFKQDGTNKKFLKSWLLVSGSWDY